MRPIHVSFRRHSADDSLPYEVAATWPQIVQWLTAPPHPTDGTPEAKKRVPLITPAVFDGRGKENANVTRVTLGMLDFDAGYQDAELGTLLRKVQGLRYCLYTSHSNQRNPWKFRLIIDIDRDVLPHEHPHFWAGLANQFDPPADPTCKSISRGYYLPATPYSDLHWAVAQEGRPLSTDALIAEGKRLGPLSPALAPARETSETVTLLDIEEHATKLRRHKDPAKKQLGSWLAKIADGRPYADLSTRHNTRLKITAELDRQWPLAHPEALAELLDDSHDAMDSGPSAYPDTVKAIEGARKHRLTRQQAFAAAQRDENTTAIRELLGRDDPYSVAEIEAYAKAAGVSLAAWRSRWMVQHQRSVYVWVAGTYRGPVALDAAPVVAKRWLAPAITNPDLGVALIKTSSTGAVQRKTSGDLLSQYGTAVTQVALSMVDNKSQLRPKDDELVIATTPRIAWEPVYSRRVADWLELLGGDHHEDLLRWLRWVGDLSQGQACLYLDGAPGTGKSLFAQSVARLWSHYGATAATAVAGNFQDSLIRCPLVFADEFMPPEWSGTNGGAKFREFLGSSNHSVNRKGLPVVSVKGYARVIAAANNPHLMRMQESLTRHDRAAIQERIFHVQTASAAAEYLRTLHAQDPRAITSIVNGELARHVVWLERHATLPRQGRFAVAATHSRVHDMLAWGQHTNAVVGEWLIGYVSDPSRWQQAARDPSSRGMITTSNGRVLVNLRALRTQPLWELYVHNPRYVPRAADLAKALDEWSLGVDTLEGVDYCVIDADQLRRFARHQRVATGDEFERGLEALVRRATLRVC